MNQAFRGIVVCGCLWFAASASAADGWSWLRLGKVPVGNSATIAPASASGVEVADPEEHAGALVFESGEVLVPNLGDSGFDDQMPRTSAFDRMTEDVFNDDDDDGYRLFETDRGAFSPSWRTAPVGGVILESGYSYIANRQHIGSEHSVPELVIRYGMTERFEARFGWNEMVGFGASMVSPVQQQSSLVTPPKTAQQEIYASRFMGGFKWRAFDQEGWFPAQTVIVEGYIPSYGNTKRDQASATYVVGWEFASHVQFNASLRYATESELHDDWGTWSPAAVLRVPLRDGWTGSLESFAVIPQAARNLLPQYYVGPGMQVLLMPGMEFNVRVGTGLSSASPLFYSSIGVGFCF